MKKIFLLIAMMLIASSFVDAQRVRGTYNKKNITIEYKKLPDDSWLITNINYAPFNELEKQKKALESKNQELTKATQSQKERIEILRDSIARMKTMKPSTVAGKTNNNEEIARLQRQYDEVSAELASNNQELNRVKSELSSKSSQYDSMKRDLDMLREQLSNKDNVIADKDDEIARLRKTLDGSGDNGSMLSAEVTYGSSSMRNNLTKQDLWGHDFSSSIQAMIAYTYYFSPSSPFALKVGVGFGNYSGKGSVEGFYDTVPGLVDEDGDGYDAQYHYWDIKEAVSLSYLEMPIMLHLGNDFQPGGIHAWIDAGLKLAFNVSSSFEGEGHYSCQGYYPSWNVTIRNIGELGFVNDALAYQTDYSPEVKSFVLWGVVAAGIHVPFGDHLSLQVGAKCGYTLTPVATHDAIDNRYVHGLSNMISGESTKIFTLGGFLGLGYKF